MLYFPLRRTLNVIKSVCAPCVGARIAGIYYTIYYERVGENKNRGKRLERDKTERTRNPSKKFRCKLHSCSVPIIFVFEIGHQS